MLVVVARIERRTVLALGGSAALGAVVGGVGVGAVMQDRGLPVSRPSTVERVTFQSWRRSRKAPYYIAHRGAGQVAPEHTIPSYQTALDWGAQVIEISVVMSADKQLYCMHDLTLDRTTTLRGRANQQTSESLDRARVTVSRLGPRWVGTHMPSLPRLADVLAAVGGRAVLCIEAKDDSAYPIMVKAIEDAGLKDTVMIKVDASSGRLNSAKKAHYPVFAYLGNPDVATATAIDRLAKRLDPERDALVLPARAGSELFSGDLIRRAVNTGVPVWVFAVHRRYEAKSFVRLGVEGIITPDLGYLSGSVAVRKVDNWASGGISAGEKTRDPYSDAYALQWEEEGVIGLDFPGRPAFVTLGQFSPIEAESYRLVFDAAFDPVPADNFQHLSVAFGHADDRYYEHRLGDADGFHALLRADGSMAIYAHVEGDPNGQLLTKSKSGTPLKNGLWSRLTLDVTPQLIRWSRDDGTAVETRDARFRGGYFHLGRSANEGMLKLRNMTVT